MRFFCIGDEDIVRGLRLAGVEGRVVESAHEAAEALRRAAARPEVGVIILSDQVAADIRPQVDALRMGLGRPLVVEVPGPEGPMPGRKTLREFVAEAVGIRIGQEDV